MDENMHVKEVQRVSKFPVITIVPLLLLVITGSQARLTEFPPDSVISRGKTNVFTCCSDIQKTIFWKHKPVGSPDPKDINDLNGLVNGYRSGRFNVTRGNSPGCYNLVTSGVTQRDEGTYSCTDDAGLGHWKGWELIVLEYFVCQETNRKAEYMGINDFDLPQDVISAVCIAKYFGNIRPTPICEWSSGTKLLDNYHRLTETNLTVTLSIQMPATKEFNEDQLFCYVKINGEFSKSETPAAWKSSPLIINYASINKKGEPQCSDDHLSLECQPLCTYETMRLSDGSTYCEITYNGKTPKKIDILLKDNDMPGTESISSSARNSVESQTSSSGTTFVIIALVATGLIGCTIILIVFLYIRLRKCKKPGNGGVKQSAIENFKENLLKVEFFNKGTIELEVDHTP